MVVVLAYGIENANFTFTRAQPSHYSLQRIELCRYNHLQFNSNIILFIFIRASDGQAQARIMGYCHYFDDYPGMQEILVQSR